ncbi:MAG: hypothetical protein FD124_3309 [Alphaproteobacteria bacterium]|nr:MAG: hypothetical protein FD160_3200 [Caulobacteraceae bacterium]TPW02693.1 MAG: hypothetical protein FD124_3309 [Alphaproteobacteria bacterium]
MNAETTIPIRLTNAEALLLSAMASIPPALARLHGEISPQGYEIALTLDEIDDLVELLRDEVVFSGLDADYALNSRGRILEDLADRLFSRFLMSTPDQV